MLLKWSARRFAVVADDAVEVDDRPGNRDAPITATALPGAQPCVPCPSWCGPLFALASAMSTRTSTRPARGTPINGTSSARPNVPAADVPRTGAVFA
jgi:hypothetical protein